MFYRLVKRCLFIFYQVFPATSSALDNWVKAFELFYNILIQIKILVRLFVRVFLNQEKTRGGSLVNFIPFSYTMPPKTLKKESFFFSKKSCPPCLDS